MKYFLIATAIILASCGQKDSKTKYDFTYGYFAKKDKAGKYPFIMNVYHITESSIEIITYNENRKVKSVLGSSSLIWTTSNKGLKVGYNESESEAIVFYNNQFYFSNGTSALGLISDLKAHNDFDNSLFLESINYSDMRAKAAPNSGLVKLSDDEVGQFESSQSVSQNDVISEIINGMDKW